MLAVTQFAIRDDDTCFFTRPEDLEAAYAGIWETIPVSLAAVPFQACTCSGALPEACWVGDGVFPIGDNAELVAFLRKQQAAGRVALMQHGYSHRDYPDGYEYEAGPDLTARTREGRAYLESTFGVPIQTFVPPHNALSRRGLAAVARNRLNLVYTGSLRPYQRPFQLRNLVLAARVRAFQRCYGVGHRYPYVLDFGTHCEVTYYTLTPRVSFDQLRTAFDFCYRVNAPFVLAVHYWEFDARLLDDGRMRVRDALARLLEYVDRFEGVEYVGVDEILQI